MLEINDKEYFVVDLISYLLEFFQALVIYSAVREISEIHQKHINARHLRRDLAIVFAASSASLKCIRPLEEDRQKKHLKSEARCRRISR